MKSASADIDVETFTDIEPIRARWRALEQNGIATPFQSLAWTSALMRTVGSARGAVPHILIAVDPSTRSDLMLLPLARQRTGPASFVKIPDFGLADYNSPLMSRTLIANPGRIEAVWKALRSKFPRADLLRIQKVPETVGGAPNPFLDVMRFRQETYSSWQLALPEKNEDVERLAISGSQRRQMRTKVKRLGEIRDIIPETVEERQQLFAHLLAQRQARFRKLKRRDTLADPAFLAFYRCLLTEPQEESGLVLRGLAVGDHVIATLLGVATKQQFYLLMVSFDEGWAENSPSVALILRTMLALQKQGCRCFDFTIGDEAYKRRFKTTQGRIYECAAPLSPLGVPMAAWLSAVPNLVMARRAVQRFRVRALDRLKQLAAKDDIGTRPEKAT